MPTSLKTKILTKKPKSRTPLDSKRHELLEQQSQLQAQIEALQRSISEAPRRAAEQARRERDYVATATVSRGRYRHNTLLDTRHDAEPAPRRARRAPMLRAERRAARRQAFALLVALVAAMLWAASTLIP
jgi:hypothetical protein